MEPFGINDQENYEHLMDKDGEAWVTHNQQMEKSTRDFNSPYRNKTLDSSAVGRGMAKTIRGPGGVRGQNN